jgi:predicted dehydrogenase
MPLRVAIVGAAGTWGRYYLGAYDRSPDCEVVALVDQATERVNVLAQRFGIKQVYSNVEELLAVDVPDIVSAIVPVSQNFPVVAACASAGVRVVSCEKPIDFSLAQADALVELCRAKGTLFACGQCYWALPLMKECFEWVSAGNIGEVTAASIPGGLPNEVSGGGCPQLSAIRLLVGQEVSWVEGFTLPSPPTYEVLPDGLGALPHEADCPAYGRLGFPNGAVCTIPPPATETGSDGGQRPRERAPVLPYMSVTGTHGQLWLGNPPVLIQGVGATAGPVYPPFLSRPQFDGVDMFDPTVARLVHAHRTGTEPLSSGHDYRQALELAIALKLSAAQGHRRVELPLEDRGLRAFPHLYRLHGGDKAGWTAIGYAGPPSPEAGERFGFGPHIAQAQGDGERALL